MGRPMTGVSKRLSGGFQSAMADTNGGKKIRVGIIGCGGISGSHLPNLERRFEDVELVAFCDVIVENARRRKPIESMAEPFTMMPRRCLPLTNSMQPTS